MVAAIEVIQNMWIPLSDGVRVAAKLWLPKSAYDTPVPAILEYIPYRKGDATVFRDHPIHAAFAANGYAGVRVDIRGTGDSEGLLLDEYLPLEQRDAIEIIDWIAAQPWCDGNLGMMGISWGGIVGLQAATHRPPALKAVIAVGASADRYYDDGSYFLGCYPGQTVGWGAVMFGFCTRPPDPAVVGDRWRTMWFERLENTPMMLETWLNHQLRDAYWLQGTVCEHYADIRVPVLAVSGWNDCWPNTVLRLVQNLDSPCRGISGPWGHVYPCFGKPGPAVGFIQEATRWWDRWLKGKDDGVVDEPPLLAYIVQGHRPDPTPADRAGRWVAEPGWPSPNVADRAWHLSLRGLCDAPADEDASMLIRSPQSTGLMSGEYMPWFVAPDAAELPLDQRADDAGSLCFDTPPLDQAMDILGTPRVRLRLACDRPTGLVAARLCDVAPDGSSTLVTYGVLNLALRDGRERLAPIEPGRPFVVTVRLNDTGYAVPAGHRLRLAISNAFWPMAWPTPDAASLTIHPGTSVLDLPVRGATAGGIVDAPFGPPDTAPPAPHAVLREPRSRRLITRDVATGVVTLDVDVDPGEVRLDDTGLAFGARHHQTYRIRDDEPLSARADYRSTFTFARDGWSVRTEARLVVSCDVEAFVLRGCISAFEGETRVFVRDWDVRVPRTAY